MSVLNLNKKIRDTENKSNLVSMLLKRNFVILSEILFIRNIENFELSRFELPRVTILSIIFSLLNFNILSCQVIILYSFIQSNCNDKLNGKNISYKYIYIFYENLIKFESTFLS